MRHQYLEQRASNSRQKAHTSAAVLALAIIYDLAWGELPSAWHPVVWLGQAIESGPRRFRGERGLGARWRGGIGSARILALAMTQARIADRALQKLPGWAAIPLRAGVLSPSFALSSLVTAADRVAAPLARGNISEARDGLSWLCSRDASALDASALSGATIASLAENSCDSVVAPLLAWAVGGAEAAWGVRAVNTLDAMIGYRGPWEDVGKAAAIVDDVVNYVPARLSGLLIVSAAACTGDDWRSAWRVMWRDHALPDSPNGGWPMAAMAGALGIRIEKLDHYCLMPEGREPAVMDIRKAQRIAGIAMLSAATLALVSPLAAQILRDGRDMEYDTNA